MSASNPAGDVTSPTGGMGGAAAQSSPPASSQGGSNNAGEPSVQPLTPTPNPDGPASRQATPSLGPGSGPSLEEPSSKNGDTATSHSAATISSTPQGHPQSTSSAGGLRSNSFSNQPLQHYPPSSTPGAGTAPTTVAASLRRLHSNSTSSTLSAAGAASPSSSTPTSIPSDASTFTTTLTTNDKPSPSNAKAARSRRHSPTLASGPSVAHLSALFSKPNASQPTSPRGLLRPLVTSPTTSEPPSPGAPTPPPKSPRTLALNNPPSSSNPATPSASMGGSQSKPAASTSNTSRSQQSNSSSHRLQKAPPSQPSAQHAPSSATTSQLSPNIPTTRGHVSRTPSPSPTPPASAPVSQPQSQQTPPPPRPQPQPAATMPAVSSAGPPNSTSSKLKRAFAGRRKKSEDATALFGKGGSGASLVQQQNRVGPESTGAGASTSSAPKAGPSAATRSSTTPLTVDTKVASDPESSSGKGANRGSIIQLSPAITSAVNYMRNIVLSEEEGEGSAHVGVATAGDESNKEKPDQEDDHRKGEDKGVDDCGKTDEGKVEQAQPQVQAQPPVLSCTTTTTAMPNPGPSSPLSPSKDAESREQERERGDQKEIWRKSDSTIGHHTIRNPGSANGTRTRPVSMAESFQSAYTVVPGGPGSSGGNKRWSTVTGELDFQVMMEDPAEEEEDLESDSDVYSSSGSPSYRADAIKSSQASSAKKLNRRSMSLNVGISSSSKPSVTPTYFNGSSANHRTADMEPQPMSYSVSEGQSLNVHSKSTATTPSGSSASSSSHSLSSTHSRALSPQPSLGPSSSGTHITSQSISMAAMHHSHTRHQHTGSMPLNVPAGRAQPAWTVTPPSAGPFQTSFGLNPKLPPPSASAQPFQSSSSSSAPISFRQTAISMSNGFAKKAAEKIGGIGKKWGLSTSSSGSGYSSTSSSNRDHGAQGSSFSSSQSHLDQGIPLVRTHSNNSSLASSMKSAASVSSGLTSNIIHHVHLPGRDKHKDKAKEDKKRNRRTPNAPSGAYSVASSTSTSDSDGFSITGAVLGRLVRGPITWNGVPVTGGMVFGKDLKAVVSQTRATPVLADEGGSSSRLGSYAALVRDLEHRVLPALVVRCAQHLLIWGLQEEGLFRVSGRASHITKLRSEFDTGVDYDLTDCTPGDLDPHAVASVFKAYLRELPEPLLTSRLQRAFEAALTQELASYPAQPMTTKITTRPTPGLPSGPKGGFNGALRKPPSLSTLAMPSFKGMPSASNRLIHHLRTLIDQLPVENRDLMRTVVELINATAAASKDTKMPLSNLLLVFCPSLNMSPPLLKALCEAEGIWDESVPEVVRQDTSSDRANHSRYRNDDYSGAQDGERQSLQSVAPSDHPSSGYNASAENSMLEDIAPGSGRTEKFERQTVPTLYLDSHSHCSSSSLSSSQDDIERLTRDVASPPPFGSVDSLLTPVSSGHPSLSHLPLNDLKKEPLIKKASARDMKASISRPIPIDTGLVQFPPSPPTPQKRRSIPILSLPSFSSSASSASQQEDIVETPATELRGKRPSLRRIFTKRSLASLGSGSSGNKHRISMFHSSDMSDSPHYTPQSASDSSVSTPLSAVTAPQSSTSLPPVIDTPIEDGPPLRRSLGIDVTPPNSATSLGTDTATTDVFTSARSSQFSFAPPTGDVDAGHSRPYLRRLDSSLSVASSNHLGLLDDEDEQEDWTRSVLIAAGATS